jgi:predicted transcriptional regulator
MVALSVRQPYAELILSGVKTIEFRNQRTHKRGRVYLYASKSSAGKIGEIVGSRMEGLPRGLIVGTIEIVGCRETRSGVYEWDLEKPKRFRRPRKPDRHPQPVWFHPF